jgi:hypothetical protein
LYVIDAVGFRWFLGLTCDFWAEFEELIFEALLSAPDSFGLKEKSRFLHCATHDETVSRFGRNDGFLVGVKEDDGKARATAKQRL